MPLGFSGVEVQVEASGALRPPTPNPYMGVYDIRGTFLGSLCISESYYLASILGPPIFVNPP